MPDSISQLLQEDHPEDGNYNTPTYSAPTHVADWAPSYDSPDHHNDPGFASRRQASVSAVANGAPAELPPSYDPPQPSDNVNSDELPDYSRACRISRAAQHVWEFRQYNRKHMLIREELPTGGLGASYAVRSRTGPSLFSKKPEITIFRERAGCERHNSVASTASSRSSIPDDDDVIATMGFDNSGPLPYMPRAWISLTEALMPNSNAALSASTGATKNIRFEARNFNDWTLTKPVPANITQTHGPIQWRRNVTATGVITLDLFAIQTGDCLARFIYSRLGTMATNGAMIGRLSIPLGGIAVEACGGRVEVLLGGFLIALKNFGRMGKHYHNKPGVQGGEEEELSDGDADLRSGSVDQSTTGLRWRNTGNMDFSPNFPSFTEGRLGHFV